MTSNALLASAALLLVAAITPGPNNLVVLRTAARSGLGAAWPAITGIVIGGLIMLAAATVGLGDALSRWPSLRTSIAFGGAAYLIWLGIELMRAQPADNDRSALPAGMVGLIVFQFLNPKSWVMVLSLVAAFPMAGTLKTFAYLAPAFVVIPGACLSLWAVAGDRLTTRLADPVTRRVADRTLGASLIASALVLVI